MDFNGSLGMPPINEEKEEDVVIPLNHPELPPEIKLKKRIRKRRADPVAATIGDNRVVLNEKIIRCEQFAHSDNIPYNFSENTNKEKLVLEHVKKYANQFQIAYVETGMVERERELFLYPLNECKVEKFICTTLRPTKLGYIEFYEYKKCADYISNFISYEPLENPIAYPSTIPSPSNTILWKKGDCFDLSILLCSLLIGVGYDAYCVIGTAPHEITLKNEALMDCPEMNLG